MFDKIPDELIATVIVIIFYLFAGYTVRHRWQQKVIINPLKIIADNSGRASLSSTQVFFFTLIVLWLAIYWVIKAGSLISIHETVLGLLGIALVGSGVGKTVDRTRFRVSAENWTWARRKKWIKNDFTQVSTEHVPKFSDLVTSDQGFDIARFQAVAFSLVVGISLFYAGATAECATAFSEIDIDDAYLGIIGISQGAYVGGKYVGAPLFAELNKILDKVRSLELAFNKAVIKSEAWRSADNEARGMKLACEQCAPEEYIAYIYATTEAADIVGSMTGNEIDVNRIQPEFPPIV